VIKILQLSKITILFFKLSNNFYAKTVAGHTDLNEAFGKNILVTTTAVVLT